MGHDQSAAREFSRLEGFAVCMGMIGVQLSSEVINQWGTYFYSPSLGVGRTVYVGIGIVGYIFIIATIWDGITDPLSGTWSDKTRTRPGAMRLPRIQGRRRPFIFWGSILMVVPAIAFWYPPVDGESNLNFVYGTAMLCLHWLLFTITVVPMLSLLPEISRSEEARVALGTWSAVGMIVGLALATVLPGELIVRLDPARTEDQLTIAYSGASDAQFQDFSDQVASMLPAELDGPAFERSEREGQPALVFSAAAAKWYGEQHDPETPLLAGMPQAQKTDFAFDHREGSFSAIGYRRLAIILALLSALMFQLPVWLIRERYNSEKQDEPHTPIIEGLVDAFSNFPFIIYFLAFLLFSAGFMAAARILPYWAELGLGGDEGTVTILMVPFILITLLSYTVIPTLARLLHIKWMLVIAFFVITTGLPCMYIVGTMDASPAVKTFLGAALFGYCGIGQGILYVMMMPMLGEIIDYDESRSGQRREALYNGLSGVAWKAAMAGAIFIATKSMDRWGNSVDDFQGVLLVGPIAGLLGLLGLIAMLFYPRLQTAKNDGG